LSFDPHVLDVQRKVVVEEFKQRYLNQPYGDVWLKLRPLAYQVHPYKWATIGKEISHIENATDADVKDFFFSHYVPSNAVLVVAGNVTAEQVKQLAEKWFEPIPSGKKPIRNIVQEPRQNAKRVLNVEASVPANALYKTYHMPGRFHADYYAIDLMSDILSRGQSSRLYHQLVKEKEIFTAVSSFAIGTIDPGLLVINGRVKDGIALEDAEAEVDAVVTKFIIEGVSKAEVEKVKNQSMSTLEFGEVEVINRAMNLASASLSGDTDMVNQEKVELEKVSTDDIKRVASTILREENSCVMYYNAVRK
jgi:zinc protease